MGSNSSKSKKSKRNISLSGRRTESKIIKYRKVSTSDGHAKETKTRNDSSSLMENKSKQELKRQNVQESPSISLYQFIIDEQYANQLIQQAREQQRQRMRDEKDVISLFQVERLDVKMKEVDHQIVKHPLDLVKKHVTHVDTSFVYPMIPRNHVHPYPDLLAFKKVNVKIFSTDINNKLVKDRKFRSDSNLIQFAQEGTYLDCTAILWLQIPLRNNDVFDSDNAFSMHLNELEKYGKYCTRLVNVIGVQFIGESQAVKKVSLAYRCGRAELTSIRNEEFVYTVDSTICENNAGQNTGQDGTCVKGIHFFLNIESAIQYYDGGYHRQHYNRYGEDKRNLYIITKRFHGKCKDKTLVARYLAIQDGKHNKIDPQESKEGRPNTFDDGDDDDRSIDQQEGELDHKHVSIVGELDMEMDRIEQLSNSQNFNPSHPILSAVNENVTYYQQCTIVRNPQTAKTLWKKAVHLFPDWEEELYC